MAKLTIQISDETRDVKLYAEAWDFTSGGKSEEDYKLIDTDGYIPVSFNNKGTIKYIMVDPPATGLTTLKIEYNDGASKIIELPIFYGMGPLMYPINSTLSSLVTGIFLKTTSITLATIECRIYGE